MKTQEVVVTLSNFVNSFSQKPEFHTLMAREHRTIQQSFTRLCLQWLEHCASDDYRYDGRNEQSHKIAKQLIEAFASANNGNPSYYLPLI